MKLPLKPNNVMLNPVLSTASNQTGLLGVYVPQHAELESEPGQELQLYNQVQEESNVELQ